MLVLQTSAVVLPQRRAVTRPAGRGQARRAAAPRQPDTARDMELICQVYCSEEQARTVVAEIVWKVSDTELSPRAFRERVNENELEVTVYKDGFEKGAFVNLFGPDPGAFRPLRDGRGEQDLVPALERLRVSRIGRLEDDSAAGPVGAERFRVESFGVRPFGSGDAEVVVVKVEGLQPGLNYYWRVPAVFRGRRVVSEVVQCKAPVCPSDARPEPEDNP